MQLYLIEYLPAILFISLFLFGLYIKRNNYTTFLIIQRKNSKKIILGFGFVICLLFFTASILITTFFLPNLLKNQVVTIHSHFVDTVLENPDKYLIPNKINQLGNYFYHIEAVEESKEGWLIKNPTFIGSDIFSSALIINHAIICSSIVFSKNQYRIITHNCNVETFSSNVVGYLFGVKNQSGTLLVEEVKTKYLEQFKNVNRKFYFPLFLKKYLDSSIEVFYFIIKKDCKWRLYQFLERAFYLLSFLSYSLLGIALSLFLKKSVSFIQSGIVLVFLGIIIPFSASYIRVSESISFAILNLTYSLPIFVSVLIGLFLLIRKTKFIITLEDQIKYLFKGVNL